jgi:aryl-alcohol dehydrogenase-like predicted oxidoreductase
MSSKVMPEYIADLIVAPPPTQMEYNRLGSSGLKVSKIILGAMSYGTKEWAKWVLEEDEALPLLEHAYMLGINTWDTVSVIKIIEGLYTDFLQADLYSDGRSEKILGKALVRYRIPRETVVIMTKCRWGTSLPGEPPLDVWAATVNDGRFVNRVGLSRKHIFDAVQASMERLGTYIDVLQIHRLDPDVPYEETMRALNDVIDKGWVRYIGASSVCCFCHCDESDLTSRCRCLRGNFKCSRPLQRNMAGTNSLVCRTITTSCTERRSAR